MNRPPKLTIVSTGIRPEHCTLEALAAMRQAQKLFYDDVNPWVASLNPNSENIAVLVGREQAKREGKSRCHSYEGAVEAVLCYLRSGQDVCWTQYGHAAIANWSCRALVRRARMEGFEAVVLPGISSLDCLFADLPFDPVVPGVQITGAQTYLAARHAFSRDIPLILLMPAQADSATDEAGGFCRLVEALISVYHPYHEVTVYRAAHPIFGPKLVRQVALFKLKHVEREHTLFIPSYGWDQSLQSRLAWKHSAEGWQRYAERLEKNFGVTRVLPPANDTPKIENKTNE
jgi:uncharacterized protein YabN with tetrapyrrole methylase and pyrophosphatase domain